MSENLHGKGLKCQLTDKPYRHVCRLPLGHKFACYCECGKYRFGKDIGLIKVEDTQVTDIEEE